MFSLESVSDCTLQDLELMTSGDLFHARLSHPEKLQGAKDNYRAVLVEFERRGLRPHGFHDDHHKMGLEHNFDPYLIPHK